MRILWVGPWGSQSSIHIGTVRTLREIGHQVNVFDYRAVYLPILRKLPSFFTQRILGRSRWLWEADRRLMNERLKRLTHVIQPHLILVAKGMGVEIDTILLLQKRGSIVANWFFDDWQRWNWVQECAGFYDFFFVFDSAMVQTLKDKGHSNVYWLPFACDPSLHRPVLVRPEDRANYGVNVCFVGNVYPERVEGLSYLQDLGLGVWGPVKWRATPLRAFYRGYISNLEPLVKLFNVCKVAVNIHWQESAGYGANFRTFEIAGTGGAVQVTDDRRDIHTLFIPEKELLMYRDWDELRQKVIYALDHSAESRQMARRAREHTCREHALRHRMEQLLQTIRSHSPKS